MTKPSTSGPDHPQFAFVLFGGTGDLAMRKILPALYAAHRDGMLAQDGKIVSVAQTALNTSSYLRWVDEHVKPYVLATAIDDSVWRSFLERIAYVALDALWGHAGRNLVDELLGATSVADMLLHDAPVVTVKVPKREKVEGQLPNCASINHVTFEAGNGALNCVDVVVAITTAGAPLTCANTR